MESMNNTPALKWFAAAAAKARILADRAEASQRYTEDEYVWQDADAFADELLECLHRIGDEVDHLEACLGIE